MYDIITIGDTTIDMFLEIDEATLNCDVKTNECQLCLTYADKIPITGAHQAIGGNAANVAAGAQKFGLRTAIVSEVGTDLNGMIIVEDLKKAGVDTSLIRMLKGKETRYAVVLNYKGERTILSYHAPRAYTLPTLPETRVLYYTSLGKTFERVQRGIRAFKKKYPTTILACNPGSYQCREGLRKTQELLPDIDILFVNKEEAEKLTQERATIPTLISHLHSSGVGIVVLTDGTNGSYASDGTALYTMKSFPVRSISRTGAGDAYASGFITAYLKTHSLPDAMRWGTAHAASVVQKFGGQAGLLTPRQIQTYIQKYRRISPTRITSTH
jgi:ribokinase